MSDAKMKPRSSTNAEIKFARLEASLLAQHPKRRDGRGDPHSLVLLRQIDPSTSETSLFI
jgi:hypothetical protein